MGGKDSVSVPWQPRGRLFVAGVHGFTEVDLGEAWGSATGGPQRAMLGGFKHPQ